MKPKYIICENKAERDAVLKKLDGRGYVWISDGEKPTKWNYNGWKDDEAIYFNISHGSGTISWGSASSDSFSDEPEKLKITAQKFLSNDKPILITRKGRIVTAGDKNTGEKAIATCSPDDTFDFGTGAMIAVARLIAQSDKGITKDAETVLRQLLGIKEVEKRVFADADRNFKVGDRVVVRDWDDMAKECGTAKSGSIHRGSGFNSGMKHLCGRTATVKSVIGDQIGVDFDDKSGDTVWSYDSWMFNPTDVPAHEKKKTEAKFKVGDLVTLKEGVNVGDTFEHLDVEEGEMFDHGHHKPMKVVEITKVGSYYCIPADGNGTGFYYHEGMLELWDESKIREGDKVYVSSASRNYPYYTEWVYEHITDSDLTKRFGYGGSITDKDKVYEVVKIAPHKDGHSMLAYIRPHVDSIGSCHLIDVDGLKKVTE